MADAKPVEWREGNDGPSYITDGQLFGIIKKEEKLKVIASNVKNVNTHVKIGSKYLTLDMSNKISVSVKNDEKCKFTQAYCVGIVCSECMEVKRDMEKYDQHVIVHTQRNEICHRCDIIFADKKSMMCHVKSCPGRPCPVEDCCQYFKFKPRYEAHIKTHK